MVVLGEGTEGSKVVSTHLEGTHPETNLYQQGFLSFFCRTRGVCCNLYKWNFGELNM